MTRPLVLTPQFFGSLLFDRRTSRYLPFDAEATRLLRGLVTDPVDAVLATAPGALGFVDQLADAGFLDLDGRLAAEVLEVAPPTDHLAGPLAVHLEVIGACNLACRHCFAGDLPRNENPLRLAEIDALAATLARMGCFRLGLTGGEPLMRRDLFDILDLAAGHGLHPCLTTNGLLITEEIARQFGRRQLVWLNVSLDGATAATNDRIRGVGTFERVLDRLRLLGRHARFTLAFTITRDSAEEVEACAALAREVGAHTAVFRPLYPVGIARRHPELMPTYEQYAGALERLAGDLHAIDPFSPQSREARRARVTLNNGCGAANLVCSVSVQGQVNPCSFLGPDHDAGNIRVTPFDELWHASAGFTRLRAAEGEAFCGGCRARALAFNGSVHAEDPWHRAWQERGRLHPMSNLEIG
jgi:radical SAM protein with 4Fe4S-binding SPASM domain